MSGILSLSNTVLSPSSHKNDQPIIYAVHNHNKINILIIPPIWLKKIIKYIQVF